MIVVVYQPQAEIYGGVVAAPVFKKISSQALSYLGVPREDNFRKRTSLVVAR
jgi:cell division protein FtsI (penicillin-binding protein 3)